ncbi:hypothetical protein MMC16_002462 [Acarospora aff. strigata]|nr:hypothetical protein [Acarospora aff. strigata]
MQIVPGTVLALVALVAAVPLPLPAQTNGISEELLDRFELFRQYSTASYCPNNTIWDKPDTKVKCTSGCPLVEAAGATIIRGGRTPLGDIGAVLAVDNTNKLLVLAIRGSSSAQNFAVDALAGFVPSKICPGCLVHQGFYGAWLELKAFLLPTLTAAVAMYPDHQIVITGHSLGGAIAIIAAAELRNKGMNIAMYSYGQPRIGNALTASYISAQTNLGPTYRATHTNDPVPRLPDVLLGYRHTSPEYWISRGDDNVAAADVVVFEAGDDRRGNAGTGGFDVESHMHYFGRIASC